MKEDLWCKFYMKMTCVIQNFKSLDEASRNNVQMLKHARVSMAAPFTYESLLFNLLGIEQRDYQGVAAIRALGDGIDSGDDWWLCADPLELKADQARVYMVGNKHLKMTEQETAQLISELNTHLHHDQLQIIAPSLYRWYIKLAADPRIMTHDWSCLVGQDIHDDLPMGENSRYWRTLLTEIQMLMHQSTINQHRIKHKQPLINSVWFWGAGRLNTQTISHHYDFIMSDDALCRGLAQLSKTRYINLNSDFKQIQSHFETAQNVLVVLDVLTMPLDELQKGLDILWNSLRANQCQQIDLYLLDAKKRVIKLPWWRRIF